MNSRGTTTVQGSQQCIQRCQELPINLCIIFGQYILFDQAELYGLFVLFQICSDHHLNLIYIYYCCFWLFELCYVIMSIICVHCIYMCLHIIVHVYLYNYDKMFIDKLQIVLKSLLTCKIHKSALEYSIIRRYTNVVYYYYYYIYYLLITICTYIYIIISLHHILSTKYNKYTQYIVFTNCNMYTYLYNNCHKKIQCLVVRE